MMELQVLRIDFTWLYRAFDVHDFQGGVSAHNVHQNIRCDKRGPVLANILAGEPEEIQELGEQVHIPLLLTYPI